MHSIQPHGIDPIIPSINRYYLLARLREILHDLTIDALVQDNSIPMRLLQLPPCEQHQHHQ